MNNVPPKQRVLDLLRAEMNRVGGVLFAEATIQESLKAKAELGDQAANRALKTGEFVNNLFDIETARTPEEAYFIELVDAMGVLAKHYQG